MDFMDLEYLVNLVDLLDFTTPTTASIGQKFDFVSYRQLQVCVSLHTVTAAGLLLPKQKFIHFWREEKKSTLVANVQMHKIR